MADKPRGKVTFKRRPQEPVVGPQGAEGQPGVDGVDGEQGIQGETGAAGPEGNQGAQGLTGEQGLAGERGQRGLRGSKGAKGDQGPPGKDGADGEDGAPGKDGKAGASAYDIWLESNPGKSKRDYLKSMKPALVTQALEVLGGGGGRAAVQQLREELEGIGHTHAPKSAVLTRDVNGAVETVTVEGEATWTLSRNPNESVASLEDGTYNVAVDRDGEGIVTGVTATEL